MTNKLKVITTKDGERLVLVNDHPISCVGDITMRMPLDDMLNATMEFALDGPIEFEDWREPSEVSGEQRAQIEQRFADGAVIQCRVKGDDSEWGWGDCHRTAYHHLDWEHFDYRLGPPK